MNAPRRAWSLLTKTRKGIVSILRDLTLEECKGSYQRLSPEYGIIIPLYERAEPVGQSQSYTYWGSASCENDIDLREVFGPDGWDRSEVANWDEWPKYEDIALSDPRHPAHQNTNAP